MWEFSLNSDSDQKLLDAVVTAIEDNMPIPRNHEDANIEREIDPFTDNVISWIPFIGDFREWYEAIGGKDLLTGKKLSTGERILSGIGGCIPFVPFRKGWNWITGLFEHGGDAAARMGRRLDDLPVAQGAHPHHGADLGGIRQAVPDYTRQLHRNRSNQTATLRRNLGTNSKTHRPHHIIPLETITDPQTRTVIEAAARGGFNINGANNGVSLLLRVHPQGARHPRYNDAVIQLVANLRARNLDDVQTARELQAIVERLRPGLERLNTSLQPLR